VQFGNSIHRSESSQIQGFRGDIVIKRGGFDFPLAIEAAQQLADLIITRESG